MARPKKGPRRHLHIDPYVYPNGSARVDKALAWYESQPAGQRTRMCWELIIAAVNGELGVASTVALGDEDAERSQAALESLLANMVMDEE
jgi:hypothetical protein